MVRQNYHFDAPLCAVKGAHMILSIAAVVLFVVIDQLLKLWMTGLLAQGPMDLIPGIIGLRYVENTGMAFGWLSGKQTVLIIVTTVMIVAICLYYKKLTSRVERISAVMIVAGGIGNLIDRVFAGYVVDFIEPLFVNFAVFNFADILVNVGCYLFLFSVIFLDKRKKPLSDSKDGDAVGKEE